jgi:hypothetical protein
MIDADPAVTAAFEAEAEPATFATDLLSEASEITSGFRSGWGSPAGLIRKKLLQ